MSREKIFLTGATGMQGSNLIRLLTDKGYFVKALAEPGADTSTIDNIKNTSVCFGNILSSQFLTEETRGIDYVIHAAASTSVVPARDKKVIEVNLYGTKNIISACHKNNVKKLIYVGSANSFGYGTFELPGNETSPFNSGKFGLDYIDSKYEAYKLVLKAANDSIVSACVVCPTFMFGKYDSGKGSGSMIIAVAKNKLPGYTNGGRNFVYVNDVAQAIANCIVLGKNGEAYVLGHQNLKYKDAFGIIGAVIGTTPPKIYIPSWASLSYGLLNEYFCFLLKKKPTVTFAISKIGNEGFYYDCTKAVVELKMPQSPIDVAIRECYEWLKLKNHIS